MDGQKVGCVVRQTDRQTSDSSPPVAWACWPGRAWCSWGGHRKAWCTRCHTSPSRCGARTPRTRPRSAWWRTSSRTWSRPGRSESCSEARGPHSHVSGRYDKDVWTTRGDNVAAWLDRWCSGYGVWLSQARVFDSAGLGGCGWDNSRLNCVHTCHSQHLTDR